MHCKSPDFVFAQNAPSTHSPLSASASQASPTSPAPQADRSAKHIRFRSSFDRAVMRAVSHDTSNAETQGPAGYTATLPLDAEQSDQALRTLLIAALATVSLLDFTGLFG